MPNSQGSPTPREAHDWTARYTVLLMLNEGARIPAIAARLGINVSNVTRRIYVFERKGYLKRGVRTSFQEWHLTQLGKSALNEMQQVRKVFGGARLNEPKNLSFRYHHLIFKISILRQPPEIIPQLIKHHFKGNRRGFMRGFEVKIRGTPVFYAGKSFLIYPAPIPAGSPHQAIEAGLRELDLILEVLARWFPQVELHNRRELCRQHLAMIGGLSELIPDGFNYSSDRIVVDASTGVIEVETVNKKYAFEDMLKIISFLDSLVKDELVMPK